MEARAKKPAEEAGPDNGPANAASVLAEYARRAQPSPERLAKLAETERLYPSQASRRCLELVDWSSPESDPVLAQFLPDPRELETRGLPEDGLGELPQSPLPRVVRKYQDRALLVTTDKCFARCRFCFRKRLWREGAAQEGEISERELDEFCAYLKRTPEIKDALLSGGDVLTLSDAKIARLIEKILSTGSVDTVRVCTRAPAVEPSRITERLAKSLASFPGVWVVTHFNHPQEFDAQAAAACGRLVSAGAPVLNQTVLLKGVNDDAKTLAKLFRTLAKNRIKPHYLFHADPVRGAAHFATGKEKGLEIMRELRATLSSIATPVFAIDLPEGGGKVPLQPDYSAGDGRYQAIDGRLLKHPLA